MINKCFIYNKKCKIVMLPGNYLTINLYFRTMAKISILYFITVPTDGQINIEHLL